MSEKHLRLTPHNVRGNKNAWWYEEKDGICVIAHVDGPNATRPAQVSIPWRYLKAAIKRLERK